MMTRKRNKSIYLMLALAGTLASCGQSGGAWEQQQAMDNCNWPASEALTFTLDVDDTVSLFNIMIDVRNRTDYPFSNLYLFVSAQAPNGATHADTMNYILANDNGEWTGKGLMSKFKDNRFPYRTNIRFPNKGAYVLKVRHGMRRDTLAGVANLGLRLEPAGRN